MVVGEARLERPDLGETAGRGRRLLVDVERRDRAPPFRDGDPGGIPDEPEVLRGRVIRGKRAALLRPAHRADDLGDAMWLPFAPRVRVLLSFRDETAVDDNEAAVRE